MERRKYSRITVSIPAVLSLYQVEACHAGIVADISEGGCFFPFGEDVPVGSRCQITITAGAGLEREQMTISGEIVRSSDSGLGIRFLENPLVKNPRLAVIIDSYRESCRV
jgi:hypothetical protein